MPEVVVTGAGFITSIGNNESEVLDSLRTLKHGIVLYPPFEPTNVPINVAAPVKGFQTDSPDPEDWSYPDSYRVRRDTLRSMPPHGLYAYCAMKQAIESANLSEDEVSNEDTGIFTASAGSAQLFHHHVDRMLNYGINRCTPMGVIASIAGTLNFNLVSAYKIRGSSTGFVSACASSGHALGAAIDEIRLGRQKRMFVVGAEDGNLCSILPFAAMRALSSSKDPDHASRPFDKNRDGFVGTGGSVVLVLEDAETARQRGATPYAKFLGWGQASDGYNVAISHPEGDGLARAIQNSLKDTGLSVDDINYINAHAPSTPIGDRSETQALKKVFEGKSPKISSTKALTGHGLSLSSILEAGIVSLSLKHSITPGSANIEELDPAMEGLNIIRETEPQSPGITLSNSSGFGGANVSLIFAPA